MITDWIALSTGIVGAVTGLASLGWNVHSWKRAGPMLRVTAKVSGHGDEMTVKGMIRNAGRFEATITDAYITWTQHEAIKVIKEKGFREAVTMVSVPPGRHLIGMSLPQVIKAQSRVEFMITGLSAIHPRLPYDIEADAVLRVGFETAAGDWAGYTVRPRYSRIPGGAASTATES